MADYGQRREQALGRLRELVAARQRWDDMNFQRMEAEEKRLKDEAYQAERKEKLNWFDDAAQGAAMGGSVGGPWGALVGGAIGTMKGQRDAYQQRKKEGQGGFEAFGNTIGDTPFGLNIGASARNDFKDFGEKESYGSLTDETMMNMGRAYGSSKASYDQQQAREGEYQPTETDIMGPESAQPDWGKPADYGQGAQTVPDNWRSYGASSPTASPATVEYYNEDPYYTDASKDPRMTAGKKRR